MDPVLLESLPLGGLELAIAAVGAAVTSLLIWARRRSATVPDDVDTNTEDGQPTAAPPVQTEVSGLARFTSGLARTRGLLSDAFSSVLRGGTVDEAALETLEETLITADVGVSTAMSLTDLLRNAATPTSTAEELQGLLRGALLERMGEAVPIAEPPPEGPLAILVVGVNGSGKTTTIGKLAARYRQAGQSVLLAAGDTFRAGAIEQLKVWGQRVGAPVVAHQEGGDPAAVVFDALQSAQAKGVDVVICDTAGRLQAQKPLMDELGKVVRVMGKAIPGAPHEVLLVLDGTIGQNAMSQARVFKEVVGVTGVALTKLDGTARGGVVVAVRDELGLPVKLVGLGEQMEDLADFAPEHFVDALLGAETSTDNLDAIG